MNNSNKLVEEIRYNSELFAIIVRKEVVVNGVRFLGLPDFPLQLGFHSHLKGKELKSHIHINLKRVIHDSQEIIHIEYGKVKVSFYNCEDKKIGTTILYSGDSLLQVKGGHGFVMLEDTKFLEVKQGPYKGVENDKRYIGGHE